MKYAYIQPKNYQHKNREQKKRENPNLIEEVYWLINDLIKELSF